MKIKFNDTFKSINYLDYLEDLFSNYDFFRTKKYSELSLEILQKRFPNSDLWLTHSATGGLEMIAKAIEIEKDDEVILSSFTFVSTVNAFVNHGAKPVFVEISEDDFNLDIHQIEAKITKKTKAVVVTHYGGHASDLDTLKQICQQHNLYLIEDAAMAYGNFYKGKPLGSIGDFAIVSFDITKQISAIQGGLLISNRSEWNEKIDAIYHIGTNRTQFMTQNKPYYEWVSVGSKYQMNELNAAALYDNLVHETEILQKRNTLSKYYLEQLQWLSESGISILPAEKIAANVHLFYLLLPTRAERDTWMEYLKKKGIETLFHYIPLHNSIMGKKYDFVDLPITVSISERLLRLPLHSQLSKEDIDYICHTIKSYRNA